MGHIIQNTDKNGNPLYPVTVTDAVVDKEGKTLTAILASGIAGQEEVYIGEEEPTDDNIKVWINPSENGDVPSEGGGDIAYVYMPIDDSELTAEQIEKNKEAYTRIINGAHMVVIIPDQEWSGVEKINVDAYYLTPEDETISFGLISHNTSTSDGAITDESVVWIAGFLSSDGTVEYDEFEEEYPDVKKLEIKVNFDGELSDEDKAHNAEVYRKATGQSGEYILYISSELDGSVFESNAFMVYPPVEDYPYLGFVVKSVSPQYSLDDYAVDVASDGSVEMYPVPSGYGVWGLGSPNTFSDLYQSMIDSGLNLFESDLWANVFVLLEDDICTLDPYYEFSTSTSGEETEYNATFFLTSVISGFKYAFNAYSDGDVCNYAITHGGVLRPTTSADTEEAKWNRMMFSGNASIDSYVNPCTFRIIANQRKAFTPLSYEPIFGDNKVVVAYKMVVWDGGFFTIQFNNDGTAQMEVIE